MNENLNVHERAERTHRGTAERHAQAARYWRDHGDEERAALELRNQRIELDAADLERDRADLDRRRAARD